MNLRIPMRLPSLRDFNHDTRMLILVSGLIAISYFGVNILLRSLYILRLNYDTTYVGAYLSSGALVFMSMGVPSGALGNRFGTRKIMLIGGWLTILGMALLPATQIVPPGLRTIWPFATQVITSAGWSMVNVNLVPALQLATSAINRAAAYALSSAIRSVGIFAGTLVGGLLPGLFAHLMGTDAEAAAPYGWALLVGAGLGLLTMVPLYKIRDGLPPRRDASAHAARGTFPLIPVAVMILYVYLRHSGWATCQAFCTPYLDESLHLSTSFIGVIGSVGQVVAIGASLLLPRMTAKWSTGGVLVMTTVGIGGSLALLAMVPTWYGAGLGNIGVLVFSALWITALQMFQMELVTEAWRGLAYGAVSMAMGLGFGSSSLVGGYIVAARGYDTLFTGGVVLSLIASVIMVAILQRGRQPAQLEHPIDMSAHQTPEAEREEIAVTG